ncbi:MAG: type I restriction enzyme HsdR N-terminal domain-containing protein [Pirellulales bacterium]|nr:type I restriction enzyme HsdR N-terminal domain-containing protein [Pirellulales bacterium]
MSLVWSEDDVRTKVVYSWLREHGFAPQDIRIEFGFKIRAGRQIISTPRTDALVSNAQGQNLLVVEVKAPDLPLTDADRDQAISYAGMVAAGNQVPFVVLTNGVDTRLYESATRELLNGESVPTSHRYAKAGYVICGDDLGLLKEVIDSFVSLCPENLHKFCASQVDSRMNVLRGSDLHCGKKYIPDLYVKRPRVSDRLRNLLDSDKRPVVLLFGRPQVGKTNFVCHEVETRLSSGQPVLFYPAIGMLGRLTSEIANDFGWLFNGAAVNSVECWTRLLRIVEKSSERLVLFVDGWNEATQEIAQSIHRDFDLLQGRQVQLVVSLTSTSCKRLLQDDAGNVESVADACGIPRSALDLLEANPEISDRRTWSIANCDSFSEDETKNAYATYSRAFNVSVPPQHVSTHDPYTLRIAMEQCKDSVLPISIYEPPLVCESIRRKADRAVGLDGNSVISSLQTLGQSLIEQGAPLPEHQAKRSLGLSLSDAFPCGLFDAALLARVPTKSLEAGVDFYYGRERDYVISHLCCKWDVKLAQLSTVAKEFSNTVKSAVGRESLTWFLSQPVYLKELLTSSKPIVFPTPVLQLVLMGLSSSWRQLDQEAALQFSLDCSITADDPRVVVEAARLAIEMTEEDDSLTSAVEEYEQMDVWLSRALTIGKLDKDAISAGLLEALKKHHWQYEQGAAVHESDISQVLIQCMTASSSATRAAASKCFGFIDPLLYFDSIGSIVEAGVDPAELLDGLEFAESELAERYYGSYCPGAMEYLKDCPESLKCEYLDVHEYLEKAIRHLPWEDTEFIRDLLEKLTPPDIDSCDEPFKHDPNNLLLPFMGDCDDG